MARIHARKKGQSGSKKPVKSDLSLVSLKKKEIEDIIVRLAKEDKKPSIIGLILRDTYAVPDVKKVTGKSIGKILEENKISYKIPEDLQALVNKSYQLKKHLENNTRDTHNKRNLNLIESKIRRLSKYYKKKGKIPQNWNMK